MGIASVFHHLHTHSYNSQVLTFSCLSLRLSKFYVEGARLSFAFLKLSGKWIYYLI